MQGNHLSFKGFSFTNAILESLLVSECLERQMQMCECPCMPKNNMWDSLAPSEITDRIQHTRKQLNRVENFGVMSLGNPDPGRTYGNPDTGKSSGNPG